MKTKFSIVIPVYFNELNLPFTYDRLNNLSKTISDADFEFIFVDDGSLDQSFQKLFDLNTKDKRVKIVKLSKNFGSFNAITAGLNYCTGDCIGIISADLQDPPELFEQMYNAWRSGKKIVMAVRKKRDDPLTSRIFAHIFYFFLYRFALPEMPKGGFDFVLIDKSIKNILNRMPEKNTSIMALIAWMGFEPEKIYYSRQKREIGKSRWNLSKKIKLFVDIFTSFSYSPIRAISSIGIFIATLSFFYAIFLIYQKFIHNINVEGWTSLIVIVLLFSGFQMIALGIIGEYLWRSLDQSKKRPQFIVDQTVGIE